MKHFPRVRCPWSVLARAAVLLLLVAPARSQEWAARDYVTKVLERSPEVGSAKAGYESASGAWKKAVGDAWLPSFATILPTPHAPATRWLLALAGCLGASWLLGQWQRHVYGPTG